MERRLSQNLTSYKLASLCYLALSLCSHQEKNPPLLAILLLDSRWRLEECELAQRGIQRFFEDFSCLIFC
ncbi:hypothetical protein XENTR_v10017369 [Xenopus tropicalis]|nr:hypothetical protein XENTR_v10017369 [Xenopus tropicalis]